MRTAQEISRNMSKIKCKDTDIEILLRKALWKKGFRYRKNPKNICGKPDLVFISKKIAVFCDSEFWHGFDWENRKKDFKVRSDFWIPKIERNMQRDREVTQRLLHDGWLVLRFWGKEIKNNLEECVQKIELSLNRRTLSNSPVKTFARKKKTV